MRNIYLNFLYIRKKEIEGIHARAKPFLISSSPRINVNGVLDSCNFSSKLRDGTTNIINFF